MEIKKGQVWECVEELNIYKVGYAIEVDSVSERGKRVYFKKDVNEYHWIGVDILEEHFKLVDKEKPNQYELGIDTFQRCESNMTKEEILSCAKFNIDKYNWRKKGQDKEDLVKIIKYAEWALKNID